MIAAAILAAAASAFAANVDLPLRGETLRVAVVGDTGSGSERVARGIRKAGRLDAILLTGDNFYPCSPKSVDDPRWSLVRPLVAIGPPVFPVLGNHDYCGGGPEPQLRWPHWRFPARQYAIRSPLADFAMLDTTPYVLGRSREAEQAVAGVFASSKARWRIAVGHHPIRSSGYHGYFPRDQVRRMREITPLLQAHRVDLYVCGHDHHMELVRGKPMHLVSGAGSDPIPPLMLRPQTIFPPEVRRERIGFAVLEITRGEIRVRFYDESGRVTFEHSAVSARSGAAGRE
ncbi:MAG TPA: metallophosphoesterase [Thermoanaerobaculia bacterium]